MDTLKIYRNTSSVVESTSGAASVGARHLNLVTLICFPSIPAYRGSRRLHKMNNNMESAYI